MVLSVIGKYNGHTNLYPTMSLENMIYLCYKQTENHANQDRILDKTVIRLQKQNTEPNYYILKKKLKKSLK